VGIWRGDLSKSLATMPNLEVLYLVDPHSQSWTDFLYHGEPYQCVMGGDAPPTQAELDIIHKNLVDYFSDNPKVKLLRYPSTIASNLIPDESLDFVFIDAIHLYEHVVSDYNAWLPKIREGGMISGDDYSDRFPGVVKAVDEIGGCKVKHQVWWKKV
jgi:hypothetical protein